MKIIPAINCKDFDNTVSRFRRSEKLFSDLNVEDPWVQLDVSDGTFTRGHRTWLEVEELKGIERNFKIEAHIMAVLPERLAKRCLQVGCERIILHAESGFDLSEVKEMVQQHNSELCIAIEPRSKAEKLYPFLEKRIVDRVLFLTVPPGLSGQPFKEHMYAEIEKLAARYPDVTIEVDGGINQQSALLCKRAGAHELTAGSYLFRPRDITLSYQELLNI